MLSRGLLSGHWSADRQAADFRAHLPRFTGENLERNLALVEALRAVAEGRGATVAQVAIAWVRVAARTSSRSWARGAGPARGVPGRRRALAEPEDLAAIEAAVPVDAVAGTRYDAGQMAFLDSERS